MHVAMGNRQRSGFLVLTFVFFMGHLFFSDTWRPLTVVDVTSMREPNRRKLNMIDVATWSNAIGDSVPGKPEELDGGYSFISRQQLEYRRRNERVGQVCRRYGIVKSPVVMDTANVTHHSPSLFNFITIPTKSHNDVKKQNQTADNFQSLSLSRDMAEFHSKLLSLQLI